MIREPAVNQRRVYNDVLTRFAVKGVPFALGLVLAWVISGDDIISAAAETMFGMIAESDRGPGRMKLSLDESEGDPLIEETSTCGRRVSFGQKASALSVRMHSMTCSSR
jgi:hypothetical protein